MDSQFLVIQDLYNIVQPRSVVLAPEGSEVMGKEVKKQKAGSTFGVQSAINPSWMTSQVCNVNRTFQYHCNPSTRTSG